MSVAVYSIDEGNSFFSTFGLAAAVTCNLKTEVPVMKGNGHIATNHHGSNINNAFSRSTRVVFASAKCAIVSLGSTDDVMVHF